MSTQWEDIVGKFDNLKAPKVSNTIVECVYKTILKRFEQMSNDCRETNPDWVDPYKDCLSFGEQLQIDNHKGKDKPKFTYEAEVAVTEDVEKPDGKKGKKSTGQKKTITKPKGKVCTATAEGRSALMFWLLKYVKEIKDMYVANNSKFPEETIVLSELETFASQPTEIGQFNISAFILNLTSKVDVNKVVEPVYGELDTLLLGKLTELFKNQGGTPTAQLTKLVNKWVQFLKLLAYQAAAHMWHKSARLDDNLIKMLLRQLVTFGNREVTLDEMFFKVLDEYIEETAKIAAEASQIRKEKTAAAKATKGTADASSTAPVSSDEPSQEPDEFLTGLDDAQDDISSSLAAEASDWNDGVDPDV